MDADEFDFDPAAFGLPAGFGAKPKPKASAAATAAAAFEKSKRTDDSIAGPSTTTALPSLEADTSKNGSASYANGQDEEAPVAGPSSISKRNDDADTREASDGADGQDQEGRDDDTEQAKGEDGEDEDADALEEDYLPVSHEAVLKDHTKAVTALSVDPAGARIVSGGYDYDVKLWDFGGMQSDFRPFKSFEPYENYHIHDVVWNDAGTHFIVVAGTLTARVYDREGNKVYETTKGDQYIRDLKNTSGHVGQLTSACWDPREPSRFLTASYDSTLRLWDTNEHFKSYKTIVLKSKERGARTKITACAFSVDGKLIAAAAMDGTINVWNTSSNFARPNSVAENAHEKDTETSGLCFSLDNRTLVSRGGDGTVKLWDTRSIKRPIAVQSNLLSLNTETNVIFSPDEKYILTGTAGSKAGIVPGKEVDARGKPGGKIIVMKRENLEIVRELTISQGSVIRLVWHTRINQIIASTSLGEIHVLYSPTLSEKGATMAASRAPKRRHALDDFVPGERPILTPHALPMFKDEHYDVSDAGTALKRKREGGLSKQAVKARKPEPPVKGPGSGGRVGEATDRHMVMGMIKGDLRSEDPREALLKYAHADQNKRFTGAWGKDQKTIYDTRTEEEDDK